MINLILINRYHVNINSIQIENNNNNNLVQENN
jgi:hypothetical protein